ncbi:MULTISPECIES: sensor domain-containing diguanylate cyclase [Methylobacterium]|uniref:diguanylate cyclase n=2 Tax=Pseudomonadota TaxID=1224 RepID=A0ABQ4STZ6_9HYPH|nr:MULTISPECIES: sensor domain-containing diguanylate cyclase [Methylobacterium]PIU08706.1 MAG: GGDEF domain-containing protein [Methylobacterium sp. CG09_land_8_20_14_0_10_71_15]PIU11443.1 MAG: GGDEF domain-containing protein [Methylobacterium sp. CG08_land_8_20_14_0_20_71_15]GBU18300.1 two component system fusion protein [Methylobacterium sp.]GJE05944.1 hypothetical protein AOPFMNJM_1250 [Methylobacterium jeotgali]
MLRTHLRDRASRLIACLGLSVTVGLTFLGAYLIKDLHDTAWRQAKINTTNLLGLMEQMVARDIEIYDLSLRAVAEQARTGAFNSLGADSLRSALFDRAATATGLGTIMVTDASGRVEVASDTRVSPGLSVGDLHDFAVHRDHADAGLYISHPRNSRASGRPVIGLSRRLATSDGTFAGIALGAIHLTYLQQRFDRLHISEGSAVNLFHSDGTLLVRQPFIGANVGRSIAKGETYRQFQQSRRGMFVGRSAVDGNARLYAFAHVDGAPLILDVAVGVDSINALWRPKAMMVGALVFGLAVVTLGLTFLLQREVVRRAAAEKLSSKANAELASQARTDGLTGLSNRRRYDELLAAEWRRAARTGAHLSLLVLDTDHFKRFNDHFGHPRGDEVLRAIADCLKMSVDPRDAFPCRIGGEEFAVILPGVDAPEAKAIAERIRRSVVDLQIAHAPEVGGVSTISIGVAHIVPSAEDEPSMLFRRADEALYEAKHAGRNRVRVHQAPVEEAVAVLRA